MKANKGFTLVELLVVIGILGILMAALFPAISAAMLSSNLTACVNQGRKLHTGITQANTDRAAMSKGNVWPRSSNGKTDIENDISSEDFSTSTDYFKKLFDIEHKGTEDWKPYLQGVDTDVLFGTGVPGFTGKNMQAANVKWVVAKGLTDEMDDIIPVLVTRNVASDQLITDTYDGTSTTEVPLGKAKGGESDLPFANKAFVLVRKGGGAESIKVKYSTLDTIYKQTSFQLNSDAQLEYIKTGASN